MCGRYTLVNLAQFTGTMSWIEPPAAVPPPRYNVAPQQDVPVVVGTGDNRGRVEAMRWGLVPPWASDSGVGNKMINARAETLLERPAFRGPLSKGRRCLVPVDGFYEWAKAGDKRQPYRVRMRTGESFALAGLWDEWPDPGGGVLRTFHGHHGRAERTSATAAPPDDGHPAAGGVPAVAGEGAAAGRRVGPAGSCRTRPRRWRRTRCRQPSATSAWTGRN